MISLLELLIVTRQRLTVRPIFYRLFVISLPRSNALFALSRPRGTSPSSSSTSIRAIEIYRFMLSFVSLSVKFTVSSFCSRAPGFRCLQTEVAFVHVWVRPEVRFEPNSQEKLRQQPLVRIQDPPCKIQPEAAAAVNKRRRTQMAPRTISMSRRPNRERSRFRVFPRLNYAKKSRD